VEHSFIDRYSDLDSFIHRLDPRTKIITTLIFVLAVVITPTAEWRAFACYFLLIGSLLILSKLPPFYVLKRALVIVPFVLVIGIFNLFKAGDPVASFHLWDWHFSITQEGLLVFSNVLVKASLSILALILLSSTTKFTNLLKGLEQLRMPKVMVMTLSFAYRYIFVLVDEAMRMWRAKESRNFGGKRIRQIRTVGNMVGTLFIRSYERGERVYAAMVSRGYDGKIEVLDSLSFSRSDVLFVSVTLPYIACVSVVILLW
jgi:cobalt/nickel transport system permease protein